VKTDYAALEAACEKIRVENAALRARFREWLGSQGLSARTVDRHDSNVRVYTDDYLLYEDANEASRGASGAELRMFFDYWFLRKCMWSSPTSMRDMAASLKKFYAFMHERGEITPKALKELNSSIKLGLPDWLDALRRYDDPDEDEDEDSWGL